MRVAASSRYQGGSAWPAKGAVTGSRAPISVRAGAKALRQGAGRCRDGRKDGAERGEGEAAGAGEFRPDFGQERAAVLHIGGDVGEIVRRQQPCGVEAIEDDEVEFRDVGLE